MKFTDQAYKGKNTFAHYLLTLILFVIGWQLIGAIPLYLYALEKAGSFANLLNSVEQNFGNLGIDQNLLLVLYVLMFLGGLIALLLGVKLIHKRPILSVLTSRKQIDWSRIFTSFISWFALSILVFLVDYFINTTDFEWNFQLIPFLILCVVAIVFIPIQVSMEEVLFRGYLLQGFSAWFKSIPAAIILSGVVFGLLHGMNPEVASLGWGVMVFYIGTGVFLSALTVMDDGLELVIGFHAANNIAAVLLVTSSWTVLKTDALFMDTSEPALGWSTFITMTLLYPLLLFFFFKKYKWGSFKSLLGINFKK